MTDGTAYTFKVTATNAGGTGAASAASNSVTPLAACTTPSAPASVSGGITTTTTIPGTITAPATPPSGYLVVSSTSGSLSAGPVNGTTYTAGGALGGGTVQYENTSTSFTASSSLSSNTTYNLFAYSYNSACTGTPFYSATSATTTATTLPLAPTIGTATAGNAQATVTFTGVSGTAAVTYTATSTPGGFTGTGSSSPITVTGLTNGTAYTFKVTATNAGGTGAASAASNSVTPLAPCTTPSAPASVSGGTTTTTTIPGTITAPATPPSGYLVVSSTSGSLSAGPVNGTTYTAGGALGGGTVQYENTSTSFTASSSLSSNTTYNLFAYSYNSACTGTPFYSATSATTTATTLPLAPTIGTATAGNAQATVTFTGVSGTAAVTYTATSTPGGFTGTGSSSPITVTGLTNGTAYTFKVTATNAGGTGAASAASNSVTPLAPCATPGAPTSLSLTSPYSGLVIGSFAAPSPSASNYLVIRTSSSTAPTAPTNGASYATGSSALGGFIVSNNTTTSFTDNSAVSGTQYWYWVYSYNTGSSCSGGPVYSTANVSNNVTVSTTPAVSTTYSSSTTYTVPAGVFAITVSAWGAGGGSGGGVANSDDNASGGGGGGAFVQKTYTVSPGNQYTLTVGSGGTAGTTAGTSGGTGNASTVTTISGSTINLSANGGGGGGGVTVASGTSGTGTAGTGGAAGTGYDVSFGGGNGTVGFATTLDETGGAGGGGAGNAGAGGNGSGSITGTTGGTGGAGNPNLAPWPGGAGASAAEQTGSAPGVAGNVPGGGAAGEANYTTAEPGAAGGNGQIVITYPEQPCATPTSPSGTLTLTVTPGQIAGSFTAPSPAPDNYLVIRTTSSTAPTAPSNGTAYANGSTALGGYIVSNNTTASFTDITVAPSTQYWYWVYSYDNTNCTGGPVYSASDITNNATSAACVEVTNTLTLTVTTTVNWSTAAWSAGHAPLPCEDAVIILNKTTAGAATATVDLDVAATVNSLTMTGTYGTAAITGAKTLALDCGANALSITGALNITSTGGSNANNAVVLVTGSALVTVGGNATIGGTSDTRASLIGGDATAGASTFKFMGNLTFNVEGSMNTLTPNLIFDGSGTQTLTNNSTAFLQQPFSILVGSSNAPTLTLAGSATSNNPTIGSTTISGGFLKINTGATLVLPGVSGTASYSLNTIASGLGTTLTNLGTLILGGATGGQTGSNFPTNFGTLALTAGTVEYDYTAAQTIYKTPTYGNLTIGDATTNPATVATAGGALTIAGNMLINSGATFAGSTFTHALSGNWTNSGGTFSFGTSTINFNAASGTQTLISGGRAVADQFFNITHTAAGTLQLVNNNVTVNGIFTNSAGVYDCNTNSLNTTVTGLATVSGGTYLAGSGAQTFNGGLTVSGAGTNFTSATGLTLSAATVTLTSGTLTAPDATGSFNVSGNWVNNGGTFANNGGAVIFSGVSQTIGGTATTQTFDSIQVANTGTLSLTGSTTTLTLTGNLDLGQSGNATNGFAFAPGIFAPGNGTTVNVAGQWANYASTFTPGTGTVNFNGSGSAQSIIGSNTFYKLSYSNSSGLSLSGNTSVTNTLTFPASGLIEPNGNVLLMGASATAISTASANAYVDGNLSWAFTGATNHAFPVGNAGTYLPVTFAYTSTPTSSTVTIGATSGSYPPAIPANVRLYPSAYWTVSQTGASATNYTMSIPSSGFTPTGTVVMLKSDNSATASSNATTGSGPYINSTAFTTIGSTNSQFALGQTAIPLTITGVTAQNKVYDGTTTATLNTGSAALSGVVSPDAVNLVSSGTTGTFASKNVGTGIVVTASGFTLSGAQAAYYTLSQPTGLTANITAASLTVTATGVNKVYDGTTAATVTLSDNRAAGDNITDAYTTASFSDKNVGNGKTVSVSGISISGPDAGNYTLNNTTATTTANITAVTLTVTATGVNKVYDGTTAATVTLNDNRAAGNNITDNYTSASFSDKNVGNGKAVSVSGISISGPDAGNYTLSNTTATTTANITAASLTVTATGVNKVYDGTTAATVTLSDNRAAGDNITDNYTSASFSDKNVGNGKAVSVSGISISGPDAGNYTLSNTTATTTANITAASLTVTATGVNKVYDGTTAATVTLSDNRVAGDNITDNYTSASFSDKNVGNGKTVSVSGISISGPDAGNYTLSNTTATTTANITAASLTITANNITKCNGATYTFAGTEFTTSGLQGSDAVSSVTLSSTGAAAGAAAGPYSITPSAAVGTGLANYTIGYVNGTMTVEAPIAVTLTQVNPDCHGNPGSLTTNTVTGGTSPYTYKVNPGAFNPSGTYVSNPLFGSLSTGGYTYAVKDVYGCIGTQGAILSPLTKEPVLINSATAPASVAICYGGTTTITTNAAGGNPAFTYTLNTNGTNGTAQQAANRYFQVGAGSYYIIVTDSHGCTYNTDTISVTQPSTALSFTSTVTTSIVSCTSSSSTIKVTAAGGYSSSYTYSDNNGSSYQAGNSFAGLAPTVQTVYNLVVKDANGCTANGQCDSTGGITVCAELFSYNGQYTSLLWGYNNNYYHTIRRDTTLPVQP